MNNATTDIIINEFYQLELKPLGVMHKNFTNNIDYFYCRVFIKDNIFVIARMDRLRDNIKISLGDCFDLIWTINDKNKDVIEIIILKKEG